MPSNKRSARPVITMRVNADAYEKLSRLAESSKPKLKMSALAERYLVAGLESDGVDLDEVREEAKAARGVVVRVLQEVAQAANEAVARVLDEYEIE